MGCEIYSVQQFFDGVKLLLAGKVDLFYDISYTEDRAREILFPNAPMAYEYYYLYSPVDNTSITQGDYASMNGHITKPLKINDLLDELKRFAL